MPGRRFVSALAFSLTAVPGLAGWALASPLSGREVAPTTNGTVLFTIRNDGVFPHDFSISGRTTPPIPAGGTAVLTVVFGQPGTQTYNSTIDDVDREMWGPFVVTGPPLSTVSTATTTPVNNSRLPLQDVADLPLPGSSSRFDYQAVDTRRRRLFIANLGAGRLIAFDVAHRRVSGMVGGLPGVRGVAVAPDLGRVYAAATDRHQLVTLNERTLRVRGRAAAGGFPDGVAYDAADALIFVSDVDGRQEMIFQARSGRR